MAEDTMADLQLPEGLLRAVAGGCRQLRRTVPQIVRRVTRRPDLLVRWPINLQQLRSTPAVNFGRALAEVFATGIGDITMIGPELMVLFLFTQLLLFLVKGALHDEHGADTWGAAADQQAEQLGVVLPAANAAANAAAAQAAQAGAQGQGQAVAPSVDWLVEQFAALQLPGQVMQAAAVGGEDEPEEMALQ